MAGTPHCLGSGNELTTSIASVLHTLPWKTRRMQDQGRMLWAKDEETPHGGYFFTIEGGPKLGLKPLPPDWRRRLDEPPAAASPKTAVPGAAPPDVVRERAPPLIAVRR